MPKVKKNAGVLFRECESGKRKSVSAKAFMDLYVSKQYYRFQLNDALDQLEHNRAVLKSEPDAERARMEMAEANRNIRPVFEPPDKFSVRDQFAMVAMAAMGSMLFVGEYDDAARTAYALADEMMARR